MKDETVWLNVRQSSKLFDRDIKTIGKHINNALEEEFDLSSVAKFATVSKYRSLEGKVANFLYMVVKNHIFIDENEYSRQKTLYLQNSHVMSVNF